MTEPVAMLSIVFYYPTNTRFNSRISLVAEGPSARSSTVVPVLDLARSTAVARSTVLCSAPYMI